MAIGKKWAGKLFGTNTGNLYVTFEGEDDALDGKIHVNDPVYGLVVYAVSGSFTADGLELGGSVLEGREGLEFGELTAIARLNRLLKKSALKDVILPPRFEGGSLRLRTPGRV